MWWELAIVTLGVLLALAAQELVQKIHRDSDVEEARESLNAELVNSKFAALERIKLSKCIGRGLDRFDEYIGDDRAEVPPSAISLLRLWPTSSWDAAVASGAVGNMESSERNSYASLISSARVLEELNRQEMDALSNIRTLRSHPELTAVSRDRLAQQIARARMLNYFLTLGARQLLEAAGAHEITLTAEDEAELAETTCSLPDEAAEAPEPAAHRD